MGNAYAVYISSAFSKRSIDLDLWGIGQTCGEHRKTGHLTNAERECI